MWAVSVKAVHPEPEHSATGAGNPGPAKGPRGQAAREHSGSLAVVSLGQRNKEFNLLGGTMRNSLDYSE